MQGGASHHIGLVGVDARDDEVAKCCDVAPESRPHHCLPHRSGGLGVVGARLHQHFHRLIKDRFFFLLRL